LQPASVPIENMEIRAATLPKKGHLLPLLKQDF
jgi:hypothetical protein